MYSFIYSEFYSWGYTERDNECFDLLSFLFKKMIFYIFIFFIFFLFFSFIVHPTSTSKKFQILYLSIVLSFVIYNIYFIIIKYFRSLSEDEAQQEDEENKNTDGAKRLNVYKIKPESTHNIIINDKCSICLDELVCDYAFLKCEHVFHFKCIERWSHVNNACPNCRHEIDSIFIHNNVSNIV